jgi:hypothetical protein
LRRFISVSVATGIDSDRCPFAANAQLFPGSLLPPVPAVVAFAFRTPDLTAQRQRLIERKFAVFEDDNRISIPAEEASGVVVAFEGPTSNAK